LEKKQTATSNKQTANEKSKRARLEREATARLSVGTNLCVRPKIENIKYIKGRLISYGKYFLK